MTVGGREFYVYRYEGKFNDIPNAAVILSYPKEAFGNPRALRVFKSTNAELSTQEILDTYSRRWPMELFFVKARENLHWINIKSSCFYKKWSIAGSRFLSYRRGMSAAHPYTSIPAERSRVPDIFHLEVPGFW